MPPLPFNRPASDGQAETRASTSTGSRLIDPVKPLKDFLLVFRSDSWTLVDYLCDSVCLLSSNPQTDHQPFSAVANRVVHEVQQGKTQQLAIRPDRQLLSYNFDLLVLFLSQDQECLSSFIHQACQVDLFQRGRNSARVCPSKQKQRIHQIAQAARFFEHA